MLFRTRFHLRWILCLCCQFQYFVAHRTLLRAALIEKGLSGAALLAFVVPLRQIGVEFKLEMQGTRIRQDNINYVCEGIGRRSFVEDSPRLS